MILSKKKLKSDIVFTGVRKVLKKLTPDQLDKLQHEIRDMQLELDNYGPES